MKMMTMFAAGLIGAVCLGASAHARAQQRFEDGYGAPERGDYGAPERGDYGAPEGASRDRREVQRYERRASRYGYRDDWRAARFERAIERRQAARELAERREAEARRQAALACQREAFRPYRAVVSVPVPLPVGPLPHELLSAKVPTAAGGQVPLAAALLLPGLLLTAR